LKGGRLASTFTVVPALLAHGAVSRIVSLGSRRCDCSLNLANACFWICDFDNKRRVTVVLQVDGGRSRRMNIPTDFLADLLEGASGDNAWDVSAECANYRSRARLLPSELS
jgi:hypothetical protein